MFKLREWGTFISLQISFLLCLCFLAFWHFYILYNLLRHFNLQFFACSLLKLYTKKTAEKTTTTTTTNRKKMRHVSAYKHILVENLFKYSCRLTCIHQFPVEAWCCPTQLHWCFSLFAWRALFAHVH